MPPAILAIAAGVGASLLGASVVGAVLVGLSVFHQLRQQRRAGGGERQRAIQTVRAAVEPAQWRIGITRSFGMMSQVAWADRRLQFTLVIGEAPIAGVSRIWVQGRGINVTARHGTTIVLTADQALGEGGSDVVMNIVFYLSGVNTAPSGSDRRITAPWATAEGFRWTADMQMQGLAYAVVYVTQDSDNSRWRAIPEIEFRTTGYMWAPPGGTAKVLTNAAEVRRWWEIEREDEPADRIDAITYASAVATCTAAAYEIHGTVAADDDPESTRSAFDLAWDGTVVDWNGLLQFLPGVARTKMLDVPSDDILELPTIRPARELHERLNQVDMRLSQSRSSDWQEHSMPPVIDTAAQERDGGVLVRDYGSVEYLTNPAVATRTGRRQLVESQGMDVELTVPYGTEAAPFRYLSLPPGSIVGVGLPGLTGKRFRLDATGPGGQDTLRLQLSEELATRYTLPGIAVSTVSPTDVVVVAPTGAASLTNVSVTVTTPGTDADDGMTYQLVIGWTVSRPASALTVDWSITPTGGTAEHEQVYLSAASTRYVTPQVRVTTTSRWFVRINHFDTSRRRSSVERSGTITISS